MSERHGLELIPYPRQFTEPVERNRPVRQHLQYAQERIEIHLARVATGVRTQEGRNQYIRRVTAYATVFARVIFRARRNVG